VRPLVPIWQLAYSPKEYDPYFAGLLTRGESYGMFTTHGVADAELRWIHSPGSLERSFEGE
jgi:hypothetical protein